MAHRNLPWHTAHMSDGSPQGWYADPFRVHDARYFSAGRPTKLVRDGDVESYDEPPSDDCDPADVAAGAGGIALSAQAALGSSAGEGLELAGLSGAYQRGPAFAALSQRRSHAGKLAAVAGTAAVAAVVAVVAIVNGSGSKAAPHKLAISAVAFVTQSARRTLAERTADTTLSGTVQAADQSVTISGTGEADFSTGAMMLNADFNVSGHYASESEIRVRGNLYFTLSVDGRNLAQATGGRDWIQMPLPQSASASLTGNDPLSSLSVLEQRGDVVRGLGMRIIDGVSCSGYAVTPSRQAMITGARQEFAKLGLPPSMTNLELRLLQGMSPPTIRAWFDADGLLREMSVNLQIDGLSGGVSGDVVMEFSHYGSPVRITAPAPSDTISYKSFLRTVVHSSDS